MSTMRSRRQFLGAGAAVAAATLGSPLLSACGGAPQPIGESTPSADVDGPASGTLRVSNWALYISPEIVPGFEKATGITVDYKEEFNDNEEWFAKYRESLARKQDIGADLAVPTQWMAARLMGLGWLDEISDARVPNKKNLRPALLNDPVDPGRKYTAPYMSGLTGLVYNPRLTGRDITTMDDVWDPAFKGKVAIFSDMQDAVGMVMLAQGNSVAKPTDEGFQQAVDFIREQKENGQIRRFTGGDYVDDIASGNLAITQAYSGDVVQLQADNPDIKFVVPQSGGMWFIDTMVIPYTTQNPHAADAFIDYVYDRSNYAKLIAYMKFVPVLSDMEDELNKINPALASNPLINPPQQTLDMLHKWATLPDEQMQKYTQAYSSVTTS